MAAVGRPDCQLPDYRSSRFYAKLFTPPLGSLFLGFPFGRSFLRLTLGLLLSLALGFFLRLTFCLLLGFSLSRFFLRLTLRNLLLRSAAFSNLSLRLLARYFTLLRDFALRSFFTRLLFGSHNLLRVGYPALSIYNKSEKSSKSSDVVNIFEIVFYRKFSCKEGENFSLKLRRFSSDEKVSQIGA